MCARGKESARANRGRHHSETREASDTYPLAFNTPSQTSPAAGAIMKDTHGWRKKATPYEVATPFPPRKDSQIG